MTDNTTYISDLDGTLLDSNAELSIYTINTLNDLINRGIKFTIATARTHVTTEIILKELNLTLPVVLMNGVAIYDIKNRRYISCEYIDSEGVNALLKAVREHIHSGFLYAIDNGELQTFYENTNSPHAKEFIKERQIKYGKKFTNVNSFEDCKDFGIVYYSVENTKDKLQKAYDELSKCASLHVEFYRDIYVTEHWYLEVCSVTASKKNGVNTLKKLSNSDYIVGFGDNLNDLSMFEVCNKTYAVKNAKDEVKNKADGVIDSNNNDGVAHFLLSETNKK